MNARIKLLLLFGLFAAPFVLAYATFHLWKPTSFVNKGTLLNPVQVLAEMPLRSNGGPEAKWSAQSSLSGKWVLLQVGDMPCDAACEGRLVGLRQIHVALGKHQSRVQRAFAIREGALDPAFAGKVPDMLWLTSAALQTELRKAVPTGSELAGRILIIDPLGNLILRYDTGAELKDVVKDMERLLKASRIG